METTPKRITFEIEKLCKDINQGSPAFIKVELFEGSVPRECFGNVDNVIRMHGGERILGWTIWQRDNILIQAEAHAVWKKPIGELIDVTPHEYNESKILFLPDKNMVFEHKTIGSVRKALTESPLVKEFLELLEERDRIFESYSENEHIVKMPRDVAMRYALIAQRANEINLQFGKEAGRNDPCPCGSGIKYKKCCGAYR